jgi:hypothetical protein
MVVASGTRAAAQPPAERDPRLEAQRRIEAVRKQLSDDRDTRVDRDRGSTGALRSADRSATPPAEELSFPRTWRESTSRRTSANAVRVTERERSILHALDSPVAVEFKDEPLSGAIDYLQRLAGEPIVLDKTVLDAVGVTYESRLSLNLKAVSLRTVLHRLLGEFGLTYVVKDQTIQVVTAEQARNMMTTRVQYVGDLLGDDPFFRFWRAAELIRTIESTVEPASWQSHGGPGSIFYDDARRALIIKSSAEFHPSRP